MGQTSRKRNQIIAITLVGGIVVAGFVGLGALMNRGAGGTGFAERSVPTVDETIISDRTAAASPEMSWITSGRLEMERLQKELEEQRKLLEQSRREAEQQAAAIREEYDAPLLQLIEKIATLETRLEETRSRPATRGPEEKLAAAVETAGNTPQRRSPADPGPGGDFITRRAPLRTPAPDQRAPAGAASTAGRGENFGQSFALATVAGPGTETRAIRKLGTYLPAGSYAPAVVLSGADAATNVSNRDNPIPVLFRITGPAVTAALGAQAPARVTLTGCTVQGSATGDLSSERVKVRLITMTCVNRRGEVLETKVAGYMAGSGKEGVRGHVVSREGANVRNAALAGALGGLGKGLASGATASLGQENASVSQILQNAGAGTLAGGAQEAASTLADYYIKRAEQYQPVVSLYGGTRVELVFLEGVELGL